MLEPCWISIDVALKLHERQIQHFGGSTGVRDLGLLDSALARPRNLYAYEESVALSRLAASYCFGISRNHPFVDGNKRAAYVVAQLFLMRNGRRVVASYEEKLDAMLRLASGTMSESELAAWFECHVTTR